MILVVSNIGSRVFLFFSIPVLLCVVIFATMIVDYHIRLLPLAAVQLLHCPVPLKRYADGAHTHWAVALQIHAIYSV